MAVTDRGTEAENRWSLKRAMKTEPGWTRKLVGSNLESNRTNDNEI